MHISSFSPTIVVVGSCSVDLVLNTQHHPGPGETVMALKSEQFFGGKGANQAVGTARLGAQVYLIGSVGSDRQGNEVLESLKREGVDTTHVHVSPDHTTGSAYVSAADGKNAIVVVPAANYDLKTEHIEAAREILEAADLVLLQLEVPMEVVERTVRICKELGKKVGIYAAPAMALSPEVVEYASFIVAKSSELSSVFSLPSSEGLTRMYPNKLFVRDDTNSTTYFTGDEMKYFRNDHSDVLHKMGMGDAFTSGFALAYAHGNSIKDCVKFGNEVSLKVAINRGSQSGLPYLRDLDVKAEGED